MAIPEQIKKIIISSFVVSGVTILSGLLSQFILPPEIPLFYGLPQTSEQIAPSILIIIPSTASLLITLVNILFISKASNIYLKKTLAFTSITISTLATITTLKIIFLVGAI